ncbi:MAG: glycosyltransferase family 9 protein [Verrucomicrobia bacterium]|nr:glycosyltransferase family 9 protein [Verrucomicrobiota bacterium]
MKILILKPSSLGDVVHALPVLRCLRRHLPASEIWWWIESGLAPLLEGDPDLTGVVRFERRRWASPSRWPALWRSVRVQRQRRFDWVIDLQSLARSGLFAWLANGRFTIGLDDAREGARGLYDMIVARLGPQMHAVDWYLEVLPRLGVPVRWDFEWLPPRPESVLAVNARWPADGRRWVALLPGARWPNKRWPAASFAALVRHLAGLEAGLSFAVLGGASDRPLGAVIAGAAPGRCVDLTGQTGLGEMVEWLRRCDWVVSNDTGPMHIAAALGKPVLGLFGPTDPRRTGPYGTRHRCLQSRLPCVPCLKEYCAHPQPVECMRALTPAFVAAQAESWMDQLRRGTDAISGEARQAQGHASAAGTEARGELP